jgi:hypothetical protein
MKKDKASQIRLLLIYKKGIQDDLVSIRSTGCGGRVGFKRAQILRATLLNQDKLAKVNNSCKGSTPSS